MEVLMRVNVYAEEMTDRVELVSKKNDDGEFTGLRFYLELPVTRGNGDPAYTEQVKGPFIHRKGDDDSSAVTFWGKRDLRKLLVKGLALLDKHYDPKPIANKFLDALLAAEAEYLTRNGWIPYAPPSPGGGAYWGKKYSDRYRTYDEAQIMSQQSAVDIQRALDAEG
jgi:hypothetical protein